VFSLLPESATDLRVGLSPADCCGIYAVSRSLIYDRMKARSLAFVPLDRGDKTRCRVLLLDGDHDLLSIGHAPDGRDGRDTIRRAFFGRSKLRVSEVARALTCSEKTIARLIAVGSLPASHELGMLTVDADQLRAWLLRHRVPARWEGSK